MMDERERRWRAQQRRLARQGRLMAALGVALMLALICGRLLAERIGAPPVALAAASTMATTSTAPLLPGETLWNGAPNFLFGNNEPYAWSSNNLDTLPAVQATLKSQHIPIIRIWFEQYNENGGAAEPDSYQEAQYSAISGTGATCFANLITGNSIAFDLHMVSLFKGRCELYEVGNEPDLSSQTPAQYIAFWNSFVPQARAIDPAAKFGGPATFIPLGGDCNSQGQCFLEQWLQGVVASGVKPDFVTFHWYTCYTEGASACMSRAHSIATVGNQELAMVAKYLGGGVPVGLTEWSANSGNPSYQFDDAWMSQYEQASLTALETSGLSFAMQFDLAGCNGWGSLDMFNVCAGPSDNSARTYEGVWAAEVARERAGGVTSSPPPPAPSTTATQASSPTPTPKPSPSPTAPPPPAKGVACIEIVGGAMTMGTCVGTFTPNAPVGQTGGQP